MENTLLFLHAYAPYHVKSLAPGGFDYSLKSVNFKLISMIKILFFSVKQNLTDD